MKTNETPRALHDMIVADFETAWDAIAKIPAGRPVGRGNFMFARQAMTLLEWASRLCQGDPTGAALTDFWAALEQIEPRYFTSLPGPCLNPDPEYLLPSSPRRGDPRAQLLWAVFDLVRNGQAHQYQQILVSLKGGGYWQITHSGAEFDRRLFYVRRHIAQGKRPLYHLAFHRDQDGDVALIVRPEVLFVDVEAAIQRAALLGRGLQFAYLERPRRPASARRAGTPRPPATPLYDFSLADLDSCLIAGGHELYTP